MKCLPAITLGLSFVLGFPTTHRSQADDREGIEFFESRIRPALVKHCYECHSVEEGKSKGGLRVDSRRSLAQGGDSGPAVVPGDPEASRLITSIRYHDPDYEMPPDGKLPDSVISDFEKWVAMGAPDPRVEAAPVETLAESTIDIEAGRDFWAYRSPVPPALPEVSETAWPRSEIDHFILAAQERNGLVHAPDARPETLVRRLYFVLCGLPPSPVEVRKWAREIGPGIEEEALARLVDHLLASPRFGERWGRHWLDVARYADSTGGDSNNVYPHAWRYRDYVIESFNADKPFDRFIREQLAGDLLPIASDREWAENLVATGFLAIGQKLVGETDERKFQAELVDEQIDATSRAFLATTLACARCHDHKSDPIPQTDYYAMAAFFRNTRTHFGLLDAQARQNSPLLDATDLGLPAGRDPLSGEELAELKAEADAAVAAMEEVRAALRTDDGVTRAKLRRSRTSRSRTEALLQSYDERGYPKSFVMGAQDREEPLETRLMIRGELDQRGPVVAAGYPQVLTRAQPQRIEGSGRLQLADWIAHPKNPLTSRVIANRLWHWLFGEGLVTTVDDFGVTGQVPSHPELLDWLAIRVVENDWSIKATIRDVVLSRTWRQASTFHPGNFEKDPDNRFLWRAHQRRLEAEAIRDALLTVSGNLEVGAPRTPLLDVAGEGTVGQNVFEPVIRAIDSDHRSVYLPRVRNVPPESLALFDAPDASGVTGAREVTTVSLQALYSLNHPFLRRQAEAFADQLLSLPADERVDFAYLRAYGRFPTARERDLAREFVRDFRGVDRESEEDPMISYCHALLCAAEFRVLD